MKHHITLLTALLLGSLATLRGADTPAFRPGKVWLDTGGKPINVHGGGVMFHQGVFQTVKFRFAANGSNT